MVTLPNFPNTALAQLRTPWIALLVVPSVVATGAFACVAPLAAVAALAAVSLPRREALYTVAALWLGNQLVGFSLVGYEWTANAVLWGWVMLIAALMACVAAEVARSLPGLLRFAGGFAIAFAVQQALHWAVAKVWLGGVEASAWPVVQELGIVSILWTGGLLAAFAGLSLVFGRVEQGARKAA